MPRVLTLKRTSPFDALPDELLIHILSYLSPETLHVAARICQRWFHLLQDDSVWRDALQQRLTLLPLLCLHPKWRHEYRLRLDALNAWTQPARRRHHRSCTQSVLVAENTLPFHAWLFNGHVLAAVKADSYLIVSVEGDALVSLDLESTAQCTAWRFKDPLLLAVGNELGQVHLFSCKKRIWQNAQDQSMNVSVSYQGKVTLPRVWQEPVPITTLRFESKQEGECIVVAGDQWGRVMVWEEKGTEEERSNHTLFKIKGCSVATTRDSVLSLAIQSQRIYVARRSGQVDCLHWLDLEKTEMSLQSSFRPFVSSVPLQLTAFDDYLLCVSHAQSFVVLLDTTTEKNVISLTTLEKQIITQSYAHLSQQGGSFILAGTAQGQVHVWRPTKGESILLPFRSYSHQNIPITALSMDNVVVCAAGSDGHIRLWDACSRQLLRLVQTKSRLLIDPLQALDTSGSAVFEAVRQRTLMESGGISFVRCRGTRLLVSLQQGVRLFDYNTTEDPIQEVNTRRSSQSRRRSHVQSPPIRSTQVQRQMRTEMADVERDRQETKRRQSEWQKRSMKANGTLDMNEEELLSYALMLSMEEQKTGSASQNQESRSNVEEDERLARELDRQING